MRNGGIISQEDTNKIVHKLPSCDTPPGMAQVELDMDMVKREREREDMVMGCRHFFSPLNLIGKFNMVWAF